MINLIRKLLSNNVKNEPTKNNWKNIYLEKSKAENGKTRWQFSYLLFKRIFDTFDFEELNPIIDKLPNLHQNTLSKDECDEIYTRIEIARYENYLSLNEAGDFAHLLAQKADLSAEDMINSIDFYLKIGEHNFQYNEKVDWENDIEHIWNELHNNSNIQITKH